MKIMVKGGKKKIGVHKGFKAAETEKKPVDAASPFAKKADKKVKK